MSYRLLAAALLRAGLCASVFVSVALTARPAVAADVTASVTPTTLAGPPPWTVTYKFELRSGPMPEPVMFEVGGFTQGSVRPEFSISVSPGEQALQPMPGLAGGRVNLCPGRRGRVETHDRSMNEGILLPANAVTTVTVSVVRRLPLGLADTSLGYFFQLSPAVDLRPEGSGVPQLFEAGPYVPISTRQPRFHVPRTVPLSMAPPVDPGSTLFSGKRLPLMGRTTPRLAGQRIELRYTRSWPAVWHRFAGVTVQKDGSFAYPSWRPRVPGLYTVMPYYRSQDARFLSSEPACGATFEVVKGVLAPSGAA